jgi:hypothetical protein
MTAPTILVHKFMRDKRLLGASFAGSSWDLWEACIKAAHAIKLTPAEISAFDAVSGGRAPPSKRVKEFVAIAGRGAGKDSIASLIAVHTAVSFDPQRSRLRPGEYAYVLAIACDRDQAALVFNYIKGYFEQVPALRNMLCDASSETITLTNRVVIQVTTNSYRAVRGRSVLCAIFDEVALFRSENSANPDFELHAAVRPGLARVANSMSVLISTAYKRSGLLYQRFKDYFGRDDADVLVVKGTTRQFNDTFDQVEIDKDLASDPAKFAAEYLSEWRDDLSTFIDRALVDAAIDHAVTVRSPQQGVRYTSFCDPSGGRGDSFTAAVAHRDGDTVVLDALVEIKAPFNPDLATRDIAIVLHSYGLRKTVADRYAAQWVVSAFARNNVDLFHSERDRSQIYLDALPLFSSGRVKLLDVPRLTNQIVALERRTFPSGQDKVNHPAGGHDDAANAAMGALVLAAGKAPMKISKELLQRASKSTPYTQLHGRMQRSARQSLTPLDGRGPQQSMKAFY